MGNLYKKIIIYTNTAKKAEHTKSQIYSYIDLQYNIKGNNMLICRDMYPGVKFLLTVQLSSKDVNVEEIIENKNYFLRILIATVSCVRKELDSDNVHHVMQISFPSTIIEIVQEMGQWGSGGSNLSETIDGYCIIMNLSDFVYLNEHFLSREI